MYSYFLELIMTEGINLCIFVWFLYLWKVGRYGEKR